MCSFVAWVDRARDCVCSSAVVDLKGGSHITKACHVSMCSGAVRGSEKTCLWRGSCFCA